MKSGMARLVGQVAGTGRAIIVYKLSDGNVQRLITERRDMRRYVY
jgi:hypothetical protein